MGGDRLGARERVHGRGVREVVQVVARLTTHVARRRGLPYSAVRHVVIGDEPEKSFQRRVKQLAELCGWVVWHTLDSTGTRAGEPDLRMVRPPRYAVAELKSQHGRLRLEQAQAIALLEHCPGVETYLWRPSDWQQIVQVLR